VRHVTRTVQRDWLNSCLGAGNRDELSVVFFVQVSGTRRLVPVCGAFVVGITRGGSKNRNPRNPPKFTGKTTITVL